MASLLVQSMRAVGVLGEQSGIDPGRPGVADFGRKLYGMGPPDPWKSVMLRVSACAVDL